MAVFLSILCVLGCVLVGLFLGYLSGHYPLVFSFIMAVLGIGLVCYYGFLEFYSLFS